MKTSHALDAGAAILTAVLSGMLAHAARAQERRVVEVVGCLTQGARDTWLLTQASEPVVASAAPSSSSAAPVVKPLGTQTLRLLDAIAYAPEHHRGHKIYVRGLLIRLPDEQRMTIS